MNKALLVGGEYVYMSPAYNVNISKTRHFAYLGGSHLAVSILQ